jgi:hypothetical protein
MEAVKGKITVQLSHIFIHFFLAYFEYISKFDGKNPLQGLFLDLK